MLLVALDGVMELFDGLMEKPSMLSWNEVEPIMKLLFAVGRLCVERWGLLEENKSVLCEYMMFWGL